jgi:hypothetical protein
MDQGILTQPFLMFLDVCVCERMVREIVLGVGNLSFFVVVS